MNAFVKFLWALFAVNALYIVYNVYKKNSHTNQAHSFDNFWISIMSTKPEASAINEEKRFSNKSENLDDGMGDELSYKFFASTIQCSDDELTQFPGSVIKQKAKNYLSDQSVLQRTKECSNYFTKVDTHGFSQVTKEEEETPIAFSIKVHREIGILEMFMALYFRPSDAYCIHVDAKASREVFATVNGIVNCYNHMFPKAAVFMPRQSVPVFWGTGGSILEADWICYREFHELGNQWKYLTSVVGTELPLVSIQRLRYVLNKNKGNVVVINEKNRNTDRQLQFWEIQR